MFDVSCFFVVMMGMERNEEGGMRASLELPCCKNVCNVMLHQLRCGGTWQMEGKLNEKGRKDESGRECGTMKFIENIVTLLQMKCIQLF